MNWPTCMLHPCSALLWTSCALCISKLLLAFFVTCTLCIHLYTCWQVERALVMEKDIKTKLSRVIRDLCNCTFDSSAITNGSFSCRYSSSDVTYRAILSSHPTQAPHRASHYLSHLKMWAESGAASFVSEMRRMWVDKHCCVLISSFDDPECQTIGTNPRCPDTVWKHHISLFLLLVVPAACSSCCL